MSQNIPTQLFVNKVFERIEDTELKNHIEKYTEISCYSAIMSIYNERYHNLHSHDVLRTIKKNEFIKIKKRWTDSVLKEYMENKPKKTIRRLQHEAATIKEQYQSINQQLFVSRYTYPTDTQAIEFIIEQIKVWASNDDSLLTDFRYFNSLSKQQKQRATYNDLAYIIGRVIVEEFNGDLSGGIVEDVLNINLFSNSRGKINVNQPFQVIDDEEFATHDNEQNTLLISGNYAVSNNLKVHLPDTLDKKIIQCILSQRTEKFATERIIVANIGKIVKTLYSSNGSKNYDLVRTRLLNLPKYGILSNISGKKMNVRYIDGVTFLDTDELIARVSVSYEVHQDIVNKQTVRMYRAELNKIDNPTAQLLLFALQKERVLFFKEKTLKENFTIHLNYQDIRNFIRFKVNSKAKNLKDVQEGLQFLLEQQILVQSFKRIGETFVITLSPLLDHEIQDLLESEISIFEDNGNLLNNNIETMLLN